MTPIRLKYIFCTVIVFIIYVTVSICMRIFDKKYPKEAHDVYYLLMHLFDRGVIAYI